MAKVKEGSSATNEQISETLTVENVNEVLTTEQPEAVKEVLTSEILENRLADAKKALNVANEAANYKETPETLKAEGNVNAARKALNDFNKISERQKMEVAFNEKLTLAKNDLMSIFNIDLTRLDELVEKSKDVKDTLKASFNTVFGQMPKFVKQGESGADVSKKSEKVSRETNGSGNVNDIVKALFDQGLTHNEMLNMGHEEGRLRNVAYKVDYAKDKLTGKYSPRVR